MEENQGERTVNITRGLVDSLTFCEVTEDELVLLENGPSSSIYLNAAIALLSIGVSTLVSMILNQNYPNVYIFAFLLVITIVTLIIGIVFAIIWIRNRGSYSKIIKRIRARVTKAEASEIIPRAVISPNEEEVAPIVETVVE